MLSLLGLGSAVLVSSRGSKGQTRAPQLVSSERPWPFRPVATPLPLHGDGLSAAEQQKRYRDVTLEDRLVVPEGCRSDLIAAWGDPLGEGRVGFNNDYLGFVSLGSDQALLTVNFEYISPVPWASGFGEVVKTEIPWSELVGALAAKGGVIDAQALVADDPLLRQIRAVTDQAMADLGIGVLHLRRTVGGWRRQPDARERRVDGLSGWANRDERLLSTGPARAVFAAQTRLGYDDGLGAEIVGTFANCAGGTTPWGTVLSAEENFHKQVCEGVYADGSAEKPDARPFECREGVLKGLGNVYGLAGNKYGWMVEINPANPRSRVMKHTALGRFRHEAVAVRTIPGAPLQVYSGCDRRGGHFYRYVSDQSVSRTDDPGNSRLLERGELQVARFHADGSGQWLPLKPETPVEPFSPSLFAKAGLDCPVELPHSDRRRAGAEAYRDDDAVRAYARRYPDLASLYEGQGDALQGAILVDAHLAASAIGATPTARPEDTELDPITGDVLVAFTSGTADDHGGADPVIFRGPSGEASWPHGWVMRITEVGADRFRWRIAATGGEPWQGGLGFANPDNLALDRSGNLWLVTDHTGKASRVFGTNSCWFVPRSGTGESAACFATAPMESELCGLSFDAEERALFLSVQHPGERHGSLRPGAQVIESYLLRDRQGQALEQVRTVPLGSNWPTQAPGRPPRPAIVVVQRRDGQPLTAA